MPVPVDVIRFAFWMEVVMKNLQPEHNLSLKQGQIQNSDASHQNFNAISGFLLLHLGGKLTQKTNESRRCNG
jgi:hypothetical protein